MASSSSVTGARDPESRGRKVALGNIMAQGEQPRHRSDDPFRILHLQYFDYGPMIVGGPTEGPPWWKGTGAERGRCGGKRTEAGAFE